jgi:hypothetical protein
MRHISVAGGTFILFWKYRDAIYDRSMPGWTFFVFPLVASVPIAPGHAGAGRDPCSRPISASNFEAPAQTLLRSRLLPKRGIAARAFAMPVDHARPH